MPGKYTISFFAMAVNILLDGGRKDDLYLNVTKRLTKQMTGTAGER